jgi:single-stranded-DNA-specific exonuclease
MIWNISPRDPNQDLITHLLKLRGLENDQFDHFLNPTLEQIHAFQLLHDTAAAAEAIAQAIAGEQMIYIHGDYDVDGVCATAIVWDFLYRVVGYKKALPFIPSRFDEGYGLSRETLDQLLEKGAQMIISVDCGVKDVELVEEYSAKGLKFVITDHHTLPTAENEHGEQAPVVSSQAVAVVHPKHPDGMYPFPEICGTTVAWKTCQAVNARLGIDHDMGSYLDLVALATVCDVMPLVDENRAIVKYGLEQMRKSTRPGLLALLRSARAEQSAVDVYHLGFVLGPRLNAAGRVASAMTALKLLANQSATQSASLASELEELNLHRQQLSRELVVNAEKQLMSQGDQFAYFVYGDEWPEGILGLAAGKLAEKFNRPVLVGSRVGDKIVGSARSPIQFHLADALKQLDSHLVRHGGHAAAAGFTLDAANADAFRTALQDLAHAGLNGQDLVKALTVDAMVEPAEFNYDLVALIDRLSPFGMGNTQPILGLSNLEVTRKRLFGKDNEHIAWMTTDPLGNTFENVAFGAAAKWGDIGIGAKVEVVGNVKINGWNGKRALEVGVKDIRRKDSP